MADDTDVISGQNVGKKIAELDPITPALRLELGSFVLPAQYGNANYGLTVFDIVGVLSKQSLGLDKVDNTSDAEKPVSVATRQELAKYWLKTDAIAPSSIEGLVEALDSKRDSGLAIPIGDVAGLAEMLGGKLNSNGSIQIWQVASLAEALENKASSGHNHLLTELSGWGNFISGLQQSLLIRPTTETVDEMINTAMENANAVDTERMILINEEASDWS